MKRILKAILLALSLFAVCFMLIFAAASIDKVYGYKTLLSTLILTVLAIDISGLAFLFYKKV